MRILVTGAAGFIGYYTVKAPMERGHDVIGLDNLDPCHDGEFTGARLGWPLARPGFSFHGLDFADRTGVGAS